MTVQKLKEEYETLKSLEDTDDGIFEFKENLLESDKEDILEFHLNILTDRTNPYLNRDIFAFFSDRKNKIKVGKFIFRKIRSVEDSYLLADLIQILGHLRSEYALEISKEFIDNQFKDIRYRAIIVLGWIGTNAELPLLNHKLKNDIDGEIRGYAATAMRQIYFNDQTAKASILTYISNSIVEETDENALTGMIITTQDLLKKKLGLKESQYGNVEGDIHLAKIKTITALEKYEAN